MVRQAASKPVPHLAPFSSARDLFHLRKPSLPLTASFLGVARHAASKPVPRVTLERVVVSG